MIFYIMTYTWIKDLLDKGYKIYRTDWEDKSWFVRMDGDKLQVFKNKKYQKFLPSINDLSTDNWTIKRN